MLNEFHGLVDASLMKLISFFQSLSMKKEI